MTEPTTPGSGGGQMNAVKMRPICPCSRPIAPYRSLSLPRSRVRPGGYSAVRCSRVIDWVPRWRSTVGRKSKYERQ